jgi:hypothetical protein
MLVLFRLFIPLGLLKPELPVIHDFADRGNGTGCDLDKVHIPFHGYLQSARAGHDPELLSGLTDEADLFIPNVFVDLKPPPKSILAGGAAAGPFFSNTGKNGYETVPA